MTTPIRLYNTLTKAKEEFQPLDPENVRMYVCGPTVYDEAHIGNARPVIVFDVLYRLLRHVYGEDKVTYVRNLTDIDDKINKRAFERWDKKRPLLQEIRTLTEKTAAQFHADVDALGNLRPNHEPRATEYVCDGEKRTDMVRIIEKLIARGHAYAAEGHVLFDVPSMPDYGRLARRTKDDMLAGARVDVAPYKKDPMDFVLWKPSDPATEPGWESPWGFGRPGWHIECSAMSGALLGETFDIHAGGIDLIFPHHENEIAQTCCAFGVEKMASVWMHNGFLQVEGEKMSKSLGNFFTIRELLHTDKFGGRSWPGAALRWTMLKTHYRQPIDWTEKTLNESVRELSVWHVLLSTMPEVQSQQDSELFAALSDDLNTAEAVAILRKRHSVARSRDSGNDEAISSLGKLKWALNFLGIDTESVADYIKSKSTLTEVSRQYLQSVIENFVARNPIYINYAHDDKKLDPVEILINARLAARAAKNWAESDRIRDELATQGIILKDNKDGTTTWEVKR